MPTLAEKQKTEAIKRMNLLHIMPRVIDDYRRSDTVYYSERQSALFDGILYWLHNNKDFVKIKDDFEKQYGALVYHAILTPTNMGRMLSLLYVSKTESEWLDDCEQITDDRSAYAYVYNLDDPDLSEIGLIGLKSINGGLSRTW